VSAVVIKPGTVEDRNVLRPDWSDVTRISEGGWRFHPLPSPEATEAGRQGIVTRLQGIGPADSAVAAHDRMEVDGVTYDVDGAPQRWPSLGGTLDHIEVVLQRVDG